MKISTVIVLGFLFLTGCTIGNGRICGPQTPAAYCDREAYQKLMYPKPFIEKWEKLGMTAEMRDQDSIDCNGGGGRYAPGFSPQEIKDERKPGESEQAARSRLHHQWERCMIKKGYHFTGECYDNEISRASPACGAP